MSRHRDSVDLHYGRDDFANQGKLVRALSRERGKDMASDYVDRNAGERAFAERRGITIRDRIVQAVEQVVPGKVRNMFEGLRLPTPVPEQESPADVNRRANRVAVERHARAVDAIFTAQDQGRPVDPATHAELLAARRELNGRREGGALDMEAAYKADPTLPREAARGDIARAVRAMQLETEVRTDPNRRADHFIERWHKLDGQTLQAYRDGRIDDYKAIRKSMGEMAQGLHRDPQLESVLAIRKQELGITMNTSRSVGAQLAVEHGIDLGLGRGLGR